MKVLVLTHDPRDTGGVGSFLAIMRRCLRNKVDIRRFVIGRRRSEVGKMATLRRIAVDYLRFIWVTTTQRFDLVHFNPEMDLRSFPRESILMFWVGFVLHRKYLVFFRGWNWDEFDCISHKPLTKLTHRPMLCRWLFFVLKRTDKVLVLSKDFKEALIANGIPPGRIEVVTTMFDGNLIRPKWRSNPDVEKPTLLFMARLVREKGPYELIDAVDLLKADHPDLTLILCGDGPEKDALQRRAEHLGVDHMIDFPGYVRGETKALLFDLADIFVFPSYFWEGMPNAVLEAMGAGLPIISTNIAGISEVMSAPDNGLFIEEVNEEYIAGSIDRMLCLPGYMPKVSKRNIEKSWRRYESFVVSTRIGDIYKDTTKAGR